MNVLILECFSLIFPPFLEEDRSHFVPANSLSPYFAVSGAHNEMISCKCDFNQNVLNRQNQTFSYHFENWHVYHVQCMKNAIFERVSKKKYCNMPGCRIPPGSKGPP